MDEVVSRAFLLPDDIPAVAPASQPLGMTRFIRTGDGHAGLESL
jgi:hypothetical protein